MAEPLSSSRLPDTLATSPDQRAVWLGLRRFDFRTVTNEDQP